MPIINCMPSQHTVLVIIPTGSLTEHSRLIIEGFTVNSTGPLSYPPSSYLPLTSPCITAPIHLFDSKKLAGCSILMTKFLFDRASSTWWNGMGIPRTNRPGKISSGSTGVQGVQPLPLGPTSNFHAPYTLFLHYLLAPLRDPRQNNRNCWWKFGIFLIWWVIWRTIV
jgi:hypothetical protein